MLGWLCSAGVAGIAGVAWWFFHPLAALWLILLSLLVYRRPVWGVSILLVTLSIDMVAPVWWGIQISFSELHLSAAVLAYLARKRDEPLDWRPLKWGVPFLAAVALSGVVNIEWYKVAPHVLRASEWLAACFLMLNVFRERGSPAEARWALACAGVLYCGAGFVQFPAAMASRIFSFFTNPNQFGGYLGMISPFFVMLFFNSSGRRIRPMWGYLALLSLVALVVSASRGALLGLSASWIALWWLHYREKVRPFMRDPIGVAGRFARRSGRALAMHGLVAGLLLVLALQLGGFDTFTQRISLLLRAHSASGAAVILGNRVPYYRLGLLVWDDNWLLGVGPGQYKKVAQARLPITKSWKIENRASLERTATIHSHNLYIQLGSELGGVGLLAFLTWIGLAFGQLASCGNAWTRAGIGLLIAFAVHNLYDVTFPSLAHEFGSLLGLALAGCQLREGLSA